MQRLTFKHHARLLPDLDHNEATLHTNWPAQRSVVEEIVGEIKEFSHVPHFSRCERTQQENRIQTKGSDPAFAAQWSNVRFTALE